MSVAVVVVGVIHLRTPAYLDGLRVELVHVVEESKVVIGEGVLWVQFRTLLKIINCLVILL